MNEKKYINERKVSEITGLALPTLRNDRSTRRRIPYIKIGRAVRYSLDDVIGFMECRKISANRGENNAAAESHQ
jgi:predicted DNA-binding transcriptional regulator AlpA